MNTAGLPRTADISVIPNIYTHAATPAFTMIHRFGTCRVGAILRLACRRFYYVPCVSPVITACHCRCRCILVVAAVLPACLTLITVSRHLRYARIAPHALPVGPSLLYPAVHDVLPACECPTARRDIIPCCPDASIPAFNALSCCTVPGRERFYLLPLPACLPIIRGLHYRARHGYRFDTNCLR